MKKYIHMRVIRSWEEICKQSNFKRISNEPGSQLLLQQLFDKLEDSEGQKKGQSLKWHNLVLRKELRSISQL